MPYSLILNLLPQSPIPQSHLSGRHLHALFLDLVRSLDPDLSTALHQQQAEKAFTLSPLQVGDRPHALQWEHRRAIAAGTPCWWRISLLDEALFGKLTQLWLDFSAKRPWHLGAADLQITSILGTPQGMQPWANCLSYEQIFAQAADGVSTDSVNTDAKTARQIRLQFYTPTAFRQTQYDSALPTKELVFRSLLKRWNQYSSIPFSESILEPIFPSLVAVSLLVVWGRSRFRFWAQLIR
jgi:CRISPR-associated endoribonuclease Cas6